VIVLHQDQSVQREIARRTSRARAARTRIPVNVAPVAESYGLLDVLGRDGSAADGEALYRVRCRECETIKRVRGKHLRGKRTKSCGCLQRKITSIRRRRESFRKRSALWFQRRKVE
jgi:hypothetical protein